MDHKSHMQRRAAEVLHGPKSKTVSIAWHIIAFNVGDIFTLNGVARECRATPREVRIAIDLLRCAGFDCPRVAFGEFQWSRRYPRKM